LNVLARGAIMPAMQRSTSWRRNFRYLWPAALVILAAASPLAGQTAQPPAPPPPPARVPSESGLDLQAIDRTVQPCTDFYQYACGRWVPPNGGAAATALDERQARNNTILHAILEEAAVGHDPATQQIGDYYAACMNADAADAQGLKALEPELKRITARLHTVGLSPLSPSVSFTPDAAFFTFDAWPDFENGRVVRPLLRQGGMGLGGREDYVESNARADDIRTQYARHVANMFRLAGDSPESAEAGAAAVMRIETSLARAASGAAQGRSPVGVFHNMRAAELQALTPAFDWARYFRALGAPASDVITVMEPEFLTAFGRIVQETPASDLRAYLRWNLLHANARALPAPFANENIRFSTTVLRGAADRRPRWQECVERTNMDLGYGLGRAFVARALGPAAKADVRGMVRRMKAALETDIASADWLSDTTKRAAIEKLHATIDKIGYPDQWRDYRGLRIARGDPLGNRLRASAFEMRRRVSTIGRPPDRASWDVPPGIARASTHFFKNSFTLTAANIQPPAYVADRDAAVNYAGIGSGIGHELTHGFDTTGRYFDGAGIMRDWWTPADARAFDERAACFSDEFRLFTPANRARPNGENISDAGGVRLALLAYLASGEAARSGVKDGFTPQQRFFIAYGQKFCNAAAAVRQTTPLHDFRVNGILMNMPEFQKAFTCAPDAPMVRTPACRVW
jgi:endothelin-converting enzyme/putative endopeptidase